MPETRRDLFKTSVISALGGLAVGAVAGYEVAERRVGRKSAVAPPNVGSVVAMHDKSAQLWYFFSFESDGGTGTNCLAYSMTDANTPTIGNIGNVDTASWFAVSDTKPLTSGPITISYLTNNGNTIVTQINFTNGHLDSGSFNWVVNNLPNNYPPVAGSWNEIGRQ